MIQAGIPSVSRSVYGEIIPFSKRFLESIVAHTVAHVEHRRRRMFVVQDVLSAFYDAIPIDLMRELQTVPQDSISYDLTSWLISIGLPQYIPQVIIITSL